MDKREVRRAAARLRHLGKLVPVGRSDEERLRQAMQELRNDDAYRDSADCPACAAERQRSGDATALCQQHLLSAMGM